MFFGNITVGRKKIMKPYIAYLPNDNREKRLSFHLNFELYLLWIYINYIKNVDRHHHIDKIIISINFNEHT